MVFSRKSLTPGMVREEIVVSRICAGEGSVEDIVFLVLRAYLAKHPGKAASLTTSLGSIGALLL